MIAIEKNANKGKLLVAVMAMLLVVVGATVALSDSSVADGNEAAIGEKEYPTLAGAVTAAGAGETVVLLKDVTLGSTIVLNGVNLDGNGHTITTGSSALVNSQGAKSIISNTVFNSTADRAIVDVSGNATAVIVNCQFTGVSTTAVYVNFATSTDVTITDCAISDSVMKEVIIALGSAQTGKVTISDCTGLRVNIADATKPSGITLGNELVIENSPIDRLNIDSNCTLTIPAEESLAADLVRGDGSIVNDGTLDVAVACQMSEENITGDGTNNLPSTANSSDSINEAFENGATAVYVDSGTLDGEIIIGEGKTLTINGTVNFGTKPTITVSGQDSVLNVWNANNATFTVTNGLEQNNSAVTFTKVTGTITVTYGSVHIDGNYGGDLSITGDVYISGTITGNTTITADERTTLITDGNITVNSSSTLVIGKNVNLVISNEDVVNVAGGLQINSGNKLTIDGILTAAYFTVVGEVENNGTMTCTNTFTVNAGAKFVNNESVKVKSFTLGSGGLFTNNGTFSGMIPTNNAAGFVNAVDGIVIAGATAPADITYEDGSIVEIHADNGDVTQYEVFNRYVNGVGNVVFGVYVQDPVYTGEPVDYYDVIPEILPIANVTSEKITIDRVATDESLKDLNAVDAGETYEFRVVINLNVANPTTASAIVEFEIQPARLDVVITGTEEDGSIPDQPYGDGTVVLTPGEDYNVQFLINGTPLEDVDYNAEIKYPADSYGTATLVITVNEKNYYGTGEEEFQIVRNLASITVENTKDTYFIGEELDLNEITITGKYDVGTGEVDVDPDDCDINPTVFTTSGPVDVEVTYPGLEPVTFTVTVIGVEKIEITNAPGKLEYTIGDELDTTGLDVTVTYADGTDTQPATTKAFIDIDGKGLIPAGGNKVDTNFVIDPKMLDTLNGTITVSYFGASDTFEVNITGGIVWYYVDGELYNTDLIAGDVAYVFNYVSEVPEGYEFVGWQVRGTEAIYQPGDSIGVGNDGKIWVDETLTFDACIVPVTEEPASETYTITLVVGTEITTVNMTVGGEKYVFVAVDVEGYEFKGWVAQGGAIYNAGTEAPEETATYVADLVEIQIVTYDVTFVVDGNSYIVSVVEGQAVAKPYDPAAPEGYEFVGWFVGDDPYDFETAVNYDLTITAKFQEVAPVYSEDVVVSMFYKAGDKLVISLADGSGQNNTIPEGKISISGYYMAKVEVPIIGVTYTSVAIPETIIDVSEGQTSIILDFEDYDWIGSVISISASFQPTAGGEPSVSNTMTFTFVAPTNEA